MWGAKLTSLVCLSSSVVLQLLQYYGIWIMVRFLLQSVICWWSPPPPTSNDLRRSKTKQVLFFRLLFPKTPIQVTVHKFLRTVCSYVWQEALSKSSWNSAERNVVVLLYTYRNYKILQKNIKFLCNVFLQLYPSNCIAQITNVPETSN